MGNSTQTTKVTEYFKYWCLYSLPAREMGLLVPCLLSTVSHLFICALSEHPSSCLQGFSSHPSSQALWNATLSTKTPVQCSSVQPLSCIRLFGTSWTAARQASLSITNSWSHPNPWSIVSVMPSNHLILCHPLLLLPSMLPSIRVFPNESALRMRWPKYWSFSFNISPFSEYPELISLRMDWLDLLAVQGTLKSLLQHHSSKASILLRSAFFIVQLSHPYMTTGKTIAFD